MLDTALFPSPYSALGMSLDLAASRWAIWAICGSARETAAGVCTKNQLLPQPHAMGPVLGQRAKHAKCSLSRPRCGNGFGSEVTLAHYFLKAVKAKSKKNNNLRPNSHDFDEDKAKVLS